MLGLTVVSLQSPNTINKTHVCALAGTSKCEIWEVGDESAEVLIHGHTDDIYTAEWHPKLPK